MYKIILFDLDGTLLDSDPMVVAAFSHLFKLYRPDYHPSKEYMMSFSGPALIDTMKKEFPNQDPIFMCEQFVKNNPYFLEHYTTIFPFVSEMIDSLHSLGVVLGIVTNKGKDQTNHCLSLFPILKKMDIVISSGDVSKPKPDPEGIYYAASCFGIKNKDDILYVGDGESDYLTAKKAQVDFAYVNWSPRQLREETYIKYRISSFKTFKEDIGFEKH